MHGQISVGMVSGCALPVLAELLAEFHDRYPGVDISLVEGNSDRLVESLRDGELDLALVGSTGSALLGVDTAVLLDDALTAVVNEHDPQAACRAIAVDALRDQPLVCLPRGTGVRGALDAACAEAGFEPRIVFEASALPMIAQLAALGLGVGILPSSAAEPHRGTLHILELYPEIRSRLELAWSPATAANPAARVLLEHTGSFVARLRRGEGSSP